jgi:hypothetical protein
MFFADGGQYVDYSLMSLHGSMNIQDAKIKIVDIYLMAMLKR